MSCCSSPSILINADKNTRLCNEIVAGTGLHLPAVPPCLTLVGSTLFVLRVLLDPRKRMFPPVVWECRSPVLPGFHPLRLADDPWGPYSGYCFPHHRDCNYHTETGGKNQARLLEYSHFVATRSFGQIHCLIRSFNRRISGILRQKLG